MKVLAGFVAAVIATYVLGALFISQGNIAAVVSMGFDITLADRIDAAIHDITHMYDLYLPLVAIGLLIGFLVAALIIRFVPDLRLVGYLSAGFVGMITLHVIMKAVLGLTGIAPTREVFGLLAQGIAGAAGGLAYHFVSLDRSKDPAEEG